MRYIDADKVHESIETLQIAFESSNDRIWEKNKPYYKGLAMARAVIDETPTADVAPRAEVARDIVEFLFRRSESLQHLFKDNPDSAQCFRGRFELENAAITIANEYGVDLTKEEAETALERSGE